MICKFCQKECKNKISLAQHERCCPENLNRKYKNGMLGKKGSNQYIKSKALGLPKPIISKETKQKMSANSIEANRIYWSNQENRDRQSEHAKRRGLGGVRQSRWIRYKDKVLGSSYELIVAKDLDENGILWDNGPRYKKIYVDPLGKYRTYTPDFYLIDYDVYLDPKNEFLINNINPHLGFSDTEKIQLVQLQNDCKIVILNKNELSWDIIKTKLKKAKPGDGSTLSVYMYRNL